MYVKTLLAVVVIVVLSCSLAAGEMYQWVDQNGVVTFKDTPPPPAKKKQKRKVKVYSDADFDAAPEQKPEATKTATAKGEAPEKAKGKRFNGTVEMYVTDWCKYCKQAESYLTSKGIPYVAYNVEKDAAARQRHKDLGGNGIPLIIIGNNKMTGFSPEAFEQYMETSR